MGSNAADKHFFYAELAKLLEAGFNIRKAAEVLSSTPLPAHQKALLRDLHEGLEGGKSIAVAFGSDRKAVTDLEREIVSAGEKGGKLGPAFQHLADYFAMLASARRETIKGLIYPIVILHLGVFIGTVPLQIMSEEKGAGGLFGGFFGTLLIIYAVLAALFLIGRMMLKKAPESAAMDSMINRIPWIGAARKNMAMSRFCKVYHSCLLAGIPMRETVRVASEASQSGMVKMAGGRIEAAAKEGNALGPPFMAEPIFPQPFSRSYATGEEAGTLDRDMGDWANRFQEQAESAMRSASTNIPKAMYFLMLAFIAWKIVGFFTGYYSALDSIGE